MHVLPISTVPNLATCERKYFRHKPPESPRTMTAARYVGNRAHEFFNLRYVPNHDAPLFLGDFSIEFDAVTPDRDAADTQAARIADRGYRALDASRWYVLPQNDDLNHVEQYGVAGRFDFMIRHMDTDLLAVCDLKTGQDVGGAMLQLGGYLYCMRKIPRGVLIHAPRAPLHKEQTATVEHWGRTELACEFELWKDRHSEVANGQKEPTASPGYQCKSCNVTCAVRAFEEEG